MTRAWRLFGQRLGATLVVLLTLQVSGWAASTVSDAAFETANRLYEEGKFSEAASAYEKLLQSGETSVALWFNLGNALFKSGRTGRALAAYRTAEQLAPRDPDLRANLQFARNQVQGPTLPPSRWQRWLGRLTLNEWTLLAAGSVWLCLLLLALRQWRPRLKPPLRVYTIATAVLAVLLCLCMVASLRQTRFNRTAIVTAPEAPAHNGPFAESAAAFTVRDGAELLVLDQKDDWLRVSAGPRRTGWIRREQAVVTGG